MENWLLRTEMLIGKENIERIKKAKIAVLGIGGVGSYVAEGLVRAGIGNLVLVDHDTIDITNINRQLIADTTTLGQSKVEIAKKRYLSINPALSITTYQEYYSKENADTLLHSDYDYVVDCIDSIGPKLHLIQTCISRNIPIVSSMGTGNKLDPTQLELNDISKTSVCPLAKIIRKELRKNGILHLPVVFSKELPKKTNTTTPASISFVPSVAGLLLSSFVIQSLIKEENTHDNSQANH